MLEQLVGEGGSLWGAAPAMALVLSASMPSGLPTLVKVRDLIYENLAVPPILTLICRPLPVVRHVFSPFHCYTSARLYVGFGSTDPQRRPSQWANPYKLLYSDPGFALGSSVPISIHVPTWLNVLPPWRVRR